MDETQRTPQPREEGMTVIELMVVVLIIGILMAIAFPTFAAQRAKAQDRGAETVLHSAMVAARTRFTEAQSYAGVTPADLHTEEPSVQFLAGAFPASASRHEVSARTGGSGQQTWALLASESASGRCFAVLHRADAAPQYQTTTATGCAADDFDPASGPWAASW